jgi:hypothetical protein
VNDDDGRLGRAVDADAADWLGAAAVVADEDVGIEQRLRSDCSSAISSRSVIDLPRALSPLPAILAARTFPANFRN